MLIFVLAIGGLVGYARFRLGRHHVVACLACRSTDGATGPMNVLVLGSDRRSGDTAAASGPTRSPAPRRLQGVEGHPGEPPRDLRVKAPNGEFVKINSFYNQGPAAMVQAVTRSPACRSTTTWR